MAPLSKRALLAAILQGARGLRWKILYLTEDHPFDVVCLRDEERYTCRIYVWNVTHGGGPRSPSEYRIQITGVTPPLLAPGGAVTLILGWHEEAGVVVAFDPELHSDPGHSPSIQIPISTIEQAAEVGIAVHRRGNEELALAFRPEYFPMYLRDQDALHKMGDSEEELALLEKAIAQGEVPDELPPSSPLHRRRRASVLLARYQRASGFRRRVLAAYGSACAMCSIQLGLVEAAHIVPVSAPLGTDATSNGLALCVLHHARYDQGLIGVEPDYGIILNEDRIDRFATLGLNDGIDTLRKGLHDEITVPASPQDRPHPDYLLEGLRLRGWDYVSLT